MNYPRFFVDSILQSQHTLILPAEQAHHAMRVLRLRAGDMVCVFNGQLGEYHGPIQFDKTQAWVELQSFHQPSTELPHPVILLQGIPSGDKMDWVIEKNTEMGVAEIIPITAQRSVLKLSGDRLDKRLTHWKKVAQAASEQCGRYRVPMISAPMSLAEAIKKYTTSTQLYACQPNAELSLNQIPSPQQTLGFLVGPEGGWSDSEQEMMRQQGITHLRFGQRVLRTETAGIALMSAISTHFNWL